MNSAIREETLRAWADDASGKLIRAGELLAGRQTLSWSGQGNVPPWAGSDDLDFHGTLTAIWIWSRAHKLTGDDRFALNIGAGWSFIENSWHQFIPGALGPSASDEAPYDCAMVLRALLADRAAAAATDQRDRGETAARLLGVYLADLDDFSGRDFNDAGFLAWNLADYARQVGDRGLLTGARRFVDRAFGMKSPPRFAGEAAVTEGLFDFSSTTATRILSVIAAEGATPFVGAWLRERVAATAPTGFVARPLDENTWNACVAAAVGRAYVVSTDTRFYDAHQAIMNELERRTEAGALGRQSGFAGETAATFYYALALDALVKV